MKQQFIQSFIRLFVQTTHPLSSLRPGQLFVMPDSGSALPVDDAHMNASVSRESMTAVDFATSKQHRRDRFKAMAELIPPPMMATIAAETNHPLVLSTPGVAHSNNTMAMTIYHDCPAIAHTAQPWPLAAFSPGWS